jgi:hypothetical protein
MQKAESCMTHRQALEADMLALERTLDTLSVRFNRELEASDISKPFNDYLKMRVDTLFEEWFKLHSLLKSLPPIIDVRIK